VLVLDIVVTVATIVAIVVAAYSDFTRGSFALGMSEKVGVPQSLLPVSGTLKAAGAAGLALGLAGVPFVGIAAATGLVLFFVGAVGVHLRAHEHRYIFITLGYLALAVASLAFAAVR
jgi:DoxX-like family